MNASEGSGSHPTKKRDEKKETLLTCSYCHACYHLSCIIANPLWNKDLPSEEQNAEPIHSTKITILGKRSNDADLNVNSATTNIEDSQEDSPS